MVKKTTVSSSKKTASKPVQTKKTNPPAVAKGSKGLTKKPAGAAGAKETQKPVPPVRSLPAQELKDIQEKLVRLRERITGQINFLATDNLSRSQNDSEVDFRSEEQGTDNFDRDFALNRVSVDQDTIFEIDEALNRVAIGTYGICECCGNAIEKARLSVLPYSRMCVACQSSSEHGRRHFRANDASTLFPNADKAAAEQAGDEE